MLMGAGRSPWVCVCFYVCVCVCGKATHLKLLVRAHVRVGIVQPHHISNVHLRRASHAPMVSSRTCRRRRTSAIHTYKHMHTLMYKKTSKHILVHVRTWFFSA
jgi:hypothetical protein